MAFVKLMTSGSCTDPIVAAKEAGYIGADASGILLAQGPVKQAISEIKRYGAPIDGLTRGEILQFLAGIVRDEDCGLRERLRAADQAVKMEGWYARKRTVEHVNVGGPSITISIEDAKKLVRARNDEISEAYRQEFVVGEKGVESICTQEKPRRRLGHGGDVVADTRHRPVPDEDKSAESSGADRQ